MQLLKMFWNHPLGVGLGGMSGKLPLFSTSDYYLSAAVELGLVGLVLIVAMGIAFVDLNYRRYRMASNPLARGLILGTIGSYITMAVTLLTFPSLLHYPIPAYLALLGGIVGVLARAAAGADRPIEGEDQTDLSQLRGLILSRLAIVRSAR